MAAYTFTAKNGTKVRVPEAWITGSGLEDVGLCLTCGDERHQTEPDARGYPCEGCGQNNVYGAQELLFMDRLEESVRRGM